MKHHSFLFKRLKREDGFMVMPVVVIGIILSIVGGILLVFFQNQSKRYGVDRMIDELDHLNTKIVMIFSTEKSCEDNLNGDGFGESLAQMDALSSAGRIQVQYPSTGPSTGVMVRSGGNYRTAKIDKVYFSGRVQIRPPDLSYFAYLNIEAKKEGSDALSADDDTIRKTVIPFYFVTDASGTLIRCIATTLPKSKEEPEVKYNPPLTLEDAICRETKRDHTSEAIGAPTAATQAYYYAPAHKTCLLGPIRPIDTSGN